MIFSVLFLKSQGFIWGKAYKDIIKKTYYVCGCPLTNERINGFSTPKAVYIADSDGLKFKQCYYGWWDHNLGIGEVLFLLWGIKVCFNVRKARTHYNEAKLITWSIYNIAVVNIIMVAIQ